MSLTWRESYKSQRSERVHHIFEICDVAVELTRYPGDTKLDATVSTLTLRCHVLLYLQNIKPKSRGGLSSCDVAIEIGGRGRFLTVE